MFRIEFIYRNLYLTKNKKIKIRRWVLLKTGCIHSLTSGNTPLNLWQWKIPLARLSQPQRARQKLWNVKFGSLFFQLQAMQKSSFIAYTYKLGELSIFCGQYFYFKKQGQFSWHKCKTQIYFIVRMWSYLRVSRKCIYFHHTKK